ncbi:MAG: hypothetical protein GY946_26450 [bacterium]|nr:hypothetical protein [bacterium]
MSSTVSTTNGCVCSGCDEAGLLRTRYYPRQLVGPEDLTADQDYFMQKLRRHNRLLHGWGIVCGVCLRRGEGDCEIIVEPGFILSPQGDEIAVGEAVTLDASKQDPMGNVLDACTEDADIWCTDVRSSRRGEEPLYVAIRYKECETRPQRVPAGGCGCDDSACEYSRIQESFEIRLLTELPDSYRMQTASPNARELCRLGRPCWPCPEDPWVILGTISFGARGDLVGPTTDYRRYVITLANQEQRCYPAQGVDIDVIDYGTLSRYYAYDLSANAAEVVTTTLTLADNSMATLHTNLIPVVGENFRDYLERVGDSPLVDDAGASYLYRDLFAFADPDLDAEVGSIHEVLAPLEAIRVDLEGLRATRSALDPLLSEEGRADLSRDRLGRPSEAHALPLSRLAGLADDSVIRNRVGEDSLTELAELAPEEFLTRALPEGAESSPELVARARELHAISRRVVRMAAAWTERRPLG